MAAAVAELQLSERIVYANVASENLSKKSLSDVAGKSWDLLDVAGN